MSAFCNPSCLTELTQFATADICSLTASMRSGEIVKLIFIRCDVLVTDITDASEINGYKALNKIVPTFPGRAKIDEKTTDGVVRIACQDVATIGKYPFEWESELVTIGGAEWSIYNDLSKNRLQLTVAFLTCDGYLLTNPKYSTPGQIGLKLDALNISPVYDGVPNGKTKYVIKGSVSEDEILKPILLEADVLALF